MLNLAMLLGCLECQGYGATIQRVHGEGAGLGVTVAGKNQEAHRTTAFLAFNPAVTSRGLFSEQSRRYTNVRQAHRTSDVHMEWSNSAGRSYAARRTFRTNRTDLADPNDLTERLISAIRTEQERKASADVLGSTWTSFPARFALIGVAYCFYPFLGEFLSLFPYATGAPGSNFFALVSIVFGTLTASTISRASFRLANLRTVTVEEVTLMLPLVKLLEKELSDDSNKEGDQELLNACLSELWGHTNMLIVASRKEELTTIADDTDAKDHLVNCLLLLEKARATRRWRRRR